MNLFSQKYFLSGGKQLLILSISIHLEVSVQQRNLWPKQRIYRKWVRNTFQIKKCFYVSVKLLREMNKIIFSLKFISKISRWADSFHFCPPLNKSFFHPSV